MMTLRGIGHAVNSTIGAASETKQYLKEKREYKAAQSSTLGQSTDNSEPHEDGANASSSDRPSRTALQSSDKGQSSQGSLVDSDSQDWELDESDDDFEESKLKPSQPRPDAPGDISPDDTVTSERQIPLSSIASGCRDTPIPVPVVLPQRRPQARSRGYGYIQRGPPVFCDLMVELIACARFVRAYPPILGEYKSIDEDVFMEFLEQFNTASKTSHVYDAINLAAFVVGLTTPQVIGTPISFAVSFAAGTAREMQRRWKTNTFLDEANERIFKPRGLYAMVLTNKPGSRTKPVIEVDLDETSAARKAQGEAAKEKKGLRLKATEAGTSRGAASIPQAAPLIFPAVEQEEAARNDVQKGGQQQPTFTSYRAYIADYLDRRRQAKFAMRNPENPLAQLPEKPFASTFADPTHQMYHHGPINMITGGRVDLWKRTREQRVALAEKKAGRELTEAERLRASYDRGFTTPAAFARRLINENVLYLVICNEPTEEQMEVAKQAMRKSKNDDETAH